MIYTITNYLFVALAIYLLVGWTAATAAHNAVAYVLLLTLWPIFLIRAIVRHRR